MRNFTKILTIMIGAAACQISWGQSGSGGISGGGSPGSIAPGGQGAGAAHASTPMPTPPAIPAENPVANEAARKAEMAGSKEAREIADARTTAASTGGTVITTSGPNPSLQYSGTSNPPHNPYVPTPGVTSGVVSAGGRPAMPTSAAGAPSPVPTVVPGVTPVPVRAAGNQ